MQALNFGRIENLRIRNGAPDFGQAPRVIRDVKFGGDAGPRPELQSEDFLLKEPVRLLFEQIGELEDATIHSLEVKHGLPFRMQIEELVA